MTATVAPSKPEQLNRVLAALRQALPDIRGTMVATTDGLSIAKSFSDNTDANRVAAMAATAHGLGKRMNDTLGSGEFSEMSISGKNGQVFLYSAGVKGVLAIMTSSETNLGLLHIEARDAAKDIASIL